jgi:hypothetical protein
MHLFEVVSRRRSQGRAHARIEIHMQDLSFHPYRAALIAPLVAPLTWLIIALLAASPAVPGSGFAGWFAVVAAGWVIAFLGTWLLALPIMMALRRWVRWTWPWLVALGAFLGAMPGLIAVIRGQLRPGPPLWEGRDFELLWFVFAACGASVAAVFCLLQAYLLKRSV